MHGHVYRMTKERNGRLDLAMHGKTNESVTARKVCLGGRRTVMAEQGEGVEVGMGGQICVLN